jgi:hypothetical protein
MPGYEVQGQRRLSIAVKLGPVHGDDNFPPRSHQMGNPASKALPNVNLGRSLLRPVLVTEQAVDLLDRMLGHQAPRLRQCLPDHRHRQRGARHHPESRPGQRIDPFGMHVVLIQIVNECSDIPQLPTKPPLRLLHDAPTEKSHMWGYNLRQPHYLEVEK